MIEPGTLPQIPGIVVIAPSPSGATAQSQVDVPMIFTNVPGLMPDPTAP